MRCDGADPAESYLEHLPLATAEANDTEGAWPRVPQRSGTVRRPPPRWRQPASPVFCGGTGALVVNVLTIARHAQSPRDISFWRLPRARGAAGGVRAPGAVARREGAAALHAGACISRMCCGFLGIARIGAAALTLIALRPARAGDRRRGAERARACSMLLLRCGRGARRTV